MNDSQIKSIGKLLDVATMDEVEKYYGNKIVAEQSNATPDTADSNTSNFII